MCRNSLWASVPFGRKLTVRNPPTQSRALWHEVYLCSSLQQHVKVNLRGARIACDTSSCQQRKSYRVCLSICPGSRLTSNCPPLLRNQLINPLASANPSLVSSNAARALARNSPALPMCHKFLMLHQPQLSRPCRCGKSCRRFRCRSGPSSAWHLREGSRQSTPAAPCAPCAPFTASHPAFATTPKRHRTQ